MNFYKIINEQTKSKNMLKEAMEKASDNKEKLTEAAIEYPDFCKGIHYRLSTDDKTLCVGSIRSSGKNKFGFTLRGVVKSFTDSRTVACFLTRDDAMRVSNSIDRNNSDIYEAYISNNTIYDLLIKLNIEDPVESADMLEALDLDYYDVVDTPVYVSYDYVLDNLDIVNPIVKKRLEKAKKIIEKSGISGIPGNPFAEKDPTMKQMQDRRAVKIQKGQQMFDYFDQKITAKYPQLHKTYDKKENQTTYYIPTNNQNISDLPITVAFRKNGTLEHLFRGRTPLIKLSLPDSFAKKLLELSEKCHQGYLTFGRGNRPKECQDAEDRLYKFSRATNNWGGEDNFIDINNGWEYGDPVDYLKVRSLLDDTLFTRKALVDDFIDRRIPAVMDRLDQFYQKCLKNEKLLDYKK